MFCRQVYESKHHYKQHHKSIASTTRIKEKDAFLNNHFNYFLIDFKFNALLHWKAQLLSFQDQKEKVLNLKAFMRGKKKSKNSQKSFSQF